MPVTPADTAQRTAGALPVSIEALGQYAEDLYDQVKLRNWASAESLLDSLKASTHNLSPASDASDAPVADVKTSLIALAGSIAARDGETAIRLSNHLTELGARLAEGYHPPIPTAITMLDLYGRELEIWATAKDVKKLRETSVALRPAKPVLDAVDTLEAVFGQ